MKISVVGTGYVGLVTGVCLSDIGHDVTCIDVDMEKVEKMKQAISPIFEPGLEELMKKNIEAGRLKFTASHKEGFADAKVIYIAVGTPPKEDGTANLSFIEQVAKDIAHSITSDVIVVTKSTVPVGTNEFIKETIQQNNQTAFQFEIVSNPEFLREGSAVHDTFYGDRIVLGTETENAAQIMEELYAPFNIPFFKTDIRSAELIKYASNAFLATKISFINEIANLCDKLGANVDDVAAGMGMDNRIGEAFLKAGIGYGGSCFPKDTKALVQIAGNVKHDFDLLKSVINVNNMQQKLLLNKAKQRLRTFNNKKIALLGLAFKPNTDDMREAASIVIAQELILNGAMVTGYDPVALDNARDVLPAKVQLVDCIDEAIMNADAVMILTEWQEIREYDLAKFIELTKAPLIFDGRNCLDLDSLEENGRIEYYSIGRPAITPTES